MKVGDLIIKIIVDGKTGQVSVKNFGDTVDRVAKGVIADTKRMKSSWTHVADSAQKVFFTLSSAKMLLAPLKEMVRLAGEQERAEIKVAQAVESTGMVAGFTADELKKMASALQSTTTFGDEEILNKVTAQLLTFTNITGDAFKRTQQTALDLATVLDGDLQSASIMLGKALNDPVSNLGALGRAGIQFSDDQEKMIKQLAKTNHLAEAQSLILDELAKQYGGQAEAAAQGSGQLKQFANILGDVKEVGGQVIQSFLLPIMNFAKPILEFLAGLDQGTATFIITLTLMTAAAWKIIPAIKGMSLATKILGISVKTALGPIGLIIAAIGILWSAWANNLFGIQDITKKVWGFIKAAFLAGWEFIKDIGKRYFNFYKGLGEIILGVFTFNKDKIKHGLATMKGALVDGWGDALNSVKEKWSGSLETYKKNNAEKVENERETQEKIVQLQTEGGKAHQALIAKQVELDGASIRLREEKEQSFFKKIESKYDEHLSVKATLQKQAQDAELQRQQLFQDAFSSGYDTFIANIYNTELTGAQRRQQIWESMRGFFTAVLADMLKKWIFTQVMQTKVEVAEGAKRKAAQASNLLAEGLNLAKVIGKNIATMAARLYASFAKMGPIGWVVGVGAVAAAIALAKKTIGSLQKGFAEGGRLKQGETGFFEGFHNEIVAPEKSFIDVVNGLISQGAIGGSNGAVLGRLDRLEESIRNMNFTFAVDGIELADATETGTKFLMRNDV